MKKTKEQKLIENLSKIFEKYHSEELSRKIKHSLKLKGYGNKK